MLAPEVIAHLFPAFEKDLVHEISEKATLRTFHQGENFMKTGQYFRSTLLVVSGLIKVFREDEDGNEYFMYYLHPGEACALSMICAARAQASKLMGDCVR